MGTAVLLGFFSSEQVLIITGTTINGGTEFEKFYKALSLRSPNELSA